MSEKYRPFIDLFLHVNVKESIRKRKIHTSLCWQIHMSEFNDGFTHNVGDA